MFGESLWKIRARSASLHFDHTVLAELIAWRWMQHRPYFAPKVKGSRVWPESLVVAATDVEAAAVGD